MRFVFRASGNREEGEEGSRSGGGYESRVHA